MFSNGKIGKCHWVTCITVGFLDKFFQSTLTNGRMAAWVTLHSEQTNCREAATLVAEFPRFFSLVNFVLIFALPNNKT